MDDFYDKVGQLTNDKPTIWAIDLERWYIDETDIEEIVYGRSCEDFSIFLESSFMDFFKKLYNRHLGKIKNALDRNDRTIREYNLLPSLVYRELDGLFALEEAMSLNGILLLQKKRKKETRLPNGHKVQVLPPFRYYPNPFVMDKIDVPNIDRVFK